MISWSWAFWIGAIFAGVSWPLFFFFPETYGPVILKNRAQRLRKETGDESIIAPIELEKTDFRHIVTTVLTRPLRMIIFIKDPPEALSSWLRYRSRSMLLPALACFDTFGAATNFGSSCDMCLAAPHFDIGMRRSC